MASFGNDSSFNAEEVAPQAPRVPLPVGDYQVVIVESEEKPTSKGTGTYLQFVMEIIDGDHKGKKLWARLNLNNPSDEAVGIARAELSAICRAVGVMKPRDSSELHNLPMVVKVGMDKNKETQEMVNKIKGYLPKGSKPGVPPSATAGKPATAAKPPADPPWKKKKTEATPPPVAAATPPVQPTAAPATAEVFE